MTENAKGRAGKRRRIVLVVAALFVVLAVLLVPPWISISRYKSSITRLISESLGRPVTLSSVELRLLPWPGFILTDLTVAEDPAYGAEPVLHANTVKVSIRLWSLWRGEMEIGRISVDEASLNLVHTGPGVWNLNDILRTATARANASSGPAAGVEKRAGARLPYLEATNSRLNIKEGAVKLPFSLLDTDLSFWQEDSGEWRVRLRGEPVRTDLSLEPGDTGTVRLEASMGRTAELKKMPIHVDLDWREAQMGQLARLIIGSDPGWRGDLTGQVQVDGTPDAAQVKTRLRASGVHRAEFAPAEPLDFDANCAFVYHATLRSVEKLVCDSPLGKGLVHLTGEVAGASPRLSLELDRVPVAAGLGVLRTIRNGLAPDLEAQGTVSGKLAYARPADVEIGALPAVPLAAKKTKAAKNPAAQGPLTGSLTVEGFGLSGGGLSEPLLTPRIVLAPAALAAAGSAPGLAGTVAMPAGAAGPLSVGVRLGLDGYQATLHGQASVKWARDMAHVTGLVESNVLDNLAGDPVQVDLTAQGRWQPDGKVADGAAPTDTIAGAVEFRNANWKADYLANHIEISRATLHFDDGQLRWDPVEFSYGPVEGRATLSLPVACAKPPCAAQFELQLGDMDAASLEAAFLGAREPDTLLSTVIARLNPTPAPPAWPELDGTVYANSLVLGAVTLAQPTIAVAIHPDHAEFTALDAGVLGGQVHGSGTMKWTGQSAGTSQTKPAYSIEAQFHELSPQAVGRLVGESWSGGEFDAEGKLDLSGFSGGDLAGSAKGTLHFDWKRGEVSAVVPREAESASEAGAVSQEASGLETANAAGEKAGAGEAKRVAVPAELARFSSWTADAVIENGKLTIGKNQVASGTRKKAIEGTVTLGEPPRVRFAGSEDVVASKR